MKCYLTKSVRASWPLKLTAHLSLITGPDILHNCPLFHSWCWLTDVREANFIIYLCINVLWGNHWEKTHIKEIKSCLTFRQSPCNNTTLSVPGGVTKQEVFVSVEMTPFFSPSLVFNQGIRSALARSILAYWGFSQSAALCYSLTQVSFIKKIRSL